MYLINAAGSPISELVGRKIYTFEPGIPLSVPDSDGRAILERIGKLGLADVPVEASDKGISFNTAAGKAAATAALRNGYRTLISNYVRDTLENRIRKGLPALPPCTATQKAFRELGETPEKYNIHPIGMEQITPQTYSEAQFDALRQAFTTQQEQFVALQNQLAALTAYVTTQPEETAEAAPSEETPSAATLRARAAAAARWNKPAQPPEVPGNG